MVCLRHMGAKLPDDGLSTSNPARGELTIGNHGSWNGYEGRRNFIVATFNGVAGLSFCRPDLRGGDKPGRQRIHSVGHRGPCDKSATGPHLPIPANWVVSTYAERERYHCSRREASTMQQSDLDGIQRSGAIARERGVSFFENPHHFAPENWTELSSAWAAGWRQADMGREEALAALDRVKFW